MRDRFARLFDRWWVIPRKKSGYWEYERRKKDVIQIKRFLNPSGENVWRLEPMLKTIRQNNNALAWVLGYAHDIDKRLPWTRCAKAGQQRSGEALTMATD